MNTENPYSPPQHPGEPRTAGQKIDWAWLLFSFDGRIPRRVFWGLRLGSAIIGFSLVFVLRLLFDEENPVAFLGTVALCVTMTWIWIAAEIRRWHDRNKHWKWIFVRFIPLVGSIWIFIEAGCLRGTPGPNVYGPDPT